MRTNIKTVAPLVAAALAITTAPFAFGQNPRPRPVENGSIQNPTTPTMTADENAGPTKGAIGKSRPMTKAPGDNATVSAKDAVFLKEAAAGGMKEIAMGENAEKNGQSDEVKNFGRQLVSDHTALNKQIMAAAKKKGITLPKATSPSLNKGSTFDKDFLHMAVEAHNNDIKAFQGEAKNGEDAEVKALAEKALPTLKHHLMMAKAAQQKVPQIDSTQSGH
jgi:putative membrane protein